MGYRTKLCLQTYHKINKGGISKKRYYTKTFKKVYQSEYTLRDCRKDPIIQEQKNLINRCFCSLVNNTLKKKSKILIVDSASKNTRMHLNSIGVKNKQILTINRGADENEIDNRNYFGCEMKNFHNIANQNNIPYYFDMAWLDIINAGDEAAQVLRNFITHNNAQSFYAGITITTRGPRKKGGKSWNTPQGFNALLKEWCNRKNILVTEVNYQKLDEITNISQVQLKQLCAGRPIPQNWSYNACHTFYNNEIKKLERTGGVLTSFWHFSKPMIS